MEIVKREKKSENKKEVEEGVDRAGQGEVAGGSFGLGRNEKKKAELFCGITNSGILSS